MSSRFSRKNISITGFVFLVLICVIVTGCSKVNENKENTIGMTNETMDTNKVDRKETDTDEIIQEDPNEAASEEAVKLETVVEEQPQEVVLSEKIEAPYEHWLAASMVVASIMKYPDLEITDIYLTGETEIASKNDSEGVYVIFNENDKQVIIHSKPLSEERKEAETADLYSADLGFSTFDMVNVDISQLETYKRIEMEQLNELISQSLLISIYEH